MPLSTELPGGGSTATFGLLWAGSRWAMARTCIFNVNAGIRFPCVHVNAAGPTPPPPPHRPLWNRQKGVEGQGGVGSNKMHWKTEMRTKEMMVKPERGLKSDGEEKAGGGRRSCTLLFNQAFDWRSLVPNRAFFLSLKWSVEPLVV